MICVVVQYKFSEKVWLADINVYVGSNSNEGIEDVLMRRYGVNRDRIDLQWSIIKHYG